MTAETQQFCKEEKTKQIKTLAPGGGAGVQGRKKVLKSLLFETVPGNVPLFLKENSPCCLSKLLQVL